MANTKTVLRYQRTRDLMHEMEALGNSLPLRNTRLLIWFDLTARLGPPGTIDFDRVDAFTQSRKTTVAEQEEYTSAEEIKTLEQASYSPDQIRRVILARAAWGAAEAELMGEGKSKKTANSSRTKIQTSTIKTIQDSHPRDDEGYQDVEMADVPSNDGPTSLKRKRSTRNTAPEDFIIQSTRTLRSRDPAPQIDRFEPDDDDGPPTPPRKTSFDLWSDEFKVSPSGLLLFEDLTITPIPSKDLANWEMLEVLKPRPEGEPPLYVLHKYLTRDEEVALVAAGWAKTEVEILSIARWLARTTQQRKEKAEREEEEREARALAKTGKLYVEDFYERNLWVSGPDPETAAVIPPLRRRTVCMCWKEDCVMCSGRKKVTTAEELEKVWAVKANKQPRDKDEGSS